jgi:hypothetical protein
LEDSFNIGAAGLTDKCEDPFNIGAAGLTDQFEDSFDIGAAALPDKIPVGIEEPRLLIYIPLNRCTLKGATASFN